MSRRQARLIDGACPEGYGYPKSMGHYKGNGGGVTRPSSPIKASPHTFGYSHIKYPCISRCELGSRSAIEWIIDRYWVRTDKASGIVNDPNAWSREHNNPRHIIDLVKKVTTVSVETMKIVDSLPQLPLGG